MTHWNILLEPETDGQFTATVAELPTVKTTAISRQTALDEIKQMLSQRLSDIEVVPVSIPTVNTENPWAKFNGIFKDDPDFEEIVKEMRAERESEL